MIGLLGGAHVHDSPASARLDRNLSGGRGLVSDRPERLHPHHVPACLPKRLADAAAQSRHEFWPDDVSLLEVGSLGWSAVLGARQVIDASLIALAVRHHGRFASFDGGVNPKTALGGKAENVVVL